MDICDECGFVYDDWSTAALPEALRNIGPRWLQALEASKDDPRLHVRPKPEVWSPLEYACHLRDVLLTQRERLYLALVEDRPAFRPMYREDRPGLARYNQQDPAGVAAEIEFAASLLGRACSYLSPEQWQRRCIYSYPTPTERTLQWLGQQTLHEGTHHLLDVKRALS